MTMTYVAIVATFVLIVLLLDAALENREIDRSRQDRAGPDRPEGEHAATAAVGYEYGAPKGPSPRKTRREAHIRGLLVLAVMIAALGGAIVFVLLVRIG
jgi:hypothetical protein